MFQTILASLYFFGVEAKFSFFGFIPLDGAIGSIVFTIII